MKNLKNDWKYTKSYASVENLEKALDKLGLLNANPIVVGVPMTNRVTALFQCSVLQRLDIAFIAVAHAGFKVV